MERYAQAGYAHLFENVDSTYMYGIDEDVPVPSNSDTSCVEVPDCAYQLSDIDLASLKLAIDPLQQSNEYGIDIYERTLQFLNRL